MNPDNYKEDYKKYIDYINSSGHPIATIDATTGNMIDSISANSTTGLSYITSSDIYNAYNPNGYEFTWGFPSNTKTPEEVESERNQALLERCDFLEKRLAAIERINEKMTSRKNSFFHVVLSPGPCLDSIELDIKGSDSEKIKLFLANDPFYKDFTVKEISLYVPF